MQVYGDFHSAAHPGRVSGVPRVATVVRELPHSLAERGHREYELDLDGGVIVHEDLLRLAEDPAPKPAA